MLPELLDQIPFALNNIHTIDIAMKGCSLSRYGLQGFVQFLAKPCNFGSCHEAPPAR
jgi:hypothetical protein